MTQAEIDKQVKDEQTKFYSQKYDGKVDIPDRMIELFKKGIMALSSFAHQMNFYKVKSIGGNTVKELTNGDVYEIIKVVGNTPLQNKYESYDEAVDYEIKLQKFVLSFNAHVDEFNVKLEMKMKTLISLSSGITPNLNGMRIVSG